MGPSQVENAEGSDEEDDKLPADSVINFLMLLAMVWGVIGWLLKIQLFLVFQIFHHIHSGISSQNLKQLEDLAKKFGQRSIHETKKEMTGEVPGT